MLTFNEISALFKSQIWAIEPSALESMMARLNCSVRIEAKKATSYTNVRGDIAVMPIFGVIDQHPSWLMDFFGGTSTEQFGRDFDAIINDSRFGAVILNIDSPGGSVFGVKELSDKIYNARGRKPIVAVTNSFNASAAYWISTAADEMVVTPSGEIGSVGVVAVHQEISKAEEQYGVRTTIIKAGRYKAEGNFHEPLNDEAREAIQKRVDEYYDDFVSSVARNRGTTAAAVKSKFGEGRMFGAKEAVERGMADRIGTLEAVGVRMAGAIAAKKKAAINNAVVKLAKCR